MIDSRHAATSKLKALFMRIPYRSSILCLCSLFTLTGLIACQDEGGLNNDIAPTTGHAGAGMTTGHPGFPEDDDKESAQPEADGSPGLPQPGFPGASTGASGGAPSSGMGPDMGTDEGANTGTPTGNDTTGTDTTPEPECNEVDPVKLFLSPDDSNSLSSPAQLKQRLLDPQGRQDLYDMPLRTWEFFNYYNFPYPEPQETLGAHMELRAIAETPGQYRLQIGVRSKNWTQESRPAMNLTFVLDTSGSMSGPALQMLKASVRAISSRLRTGDKVSMVTWSNDQQVLLDSHTASGPNDPAILQLADRLQANGGTDLNAGLTRGYALAQKNYLNNAINRVILISDGGANMGVVSADLIGRNASDSGKDGIYLAGVGVGDEAGYHDKLMDAVTDAGKGASVFVYSDAEAQRIFGDNFFSTFGIAAKNVRVELNLPAGFELVKFSGEEASTDPTEVEPQHLGPNDSMVFYQEIKTCAPDKFKPDALIKVVVRYTDALTHQPGQLTLESSFAQLAQAPAPALEKGSSLTYFLDALKALQTKQSDAANLRGKALGQLDAQIALHPADTELVELKTMLTRVMH